MPRASKPQPAETSGPRLVRKTTPKPPIPTSPSEDDIATRAYQIFELEGRQHGNHLEHWMRAQRELLEAMRPAKRAVGARARR
jgi:hypothetical protein